MADEHGPSSASDAGQQPGAAGADNGFRCVCGSLLARRVPEGVELKCRRCKRTLVIPLEDGEPGP